MKRKALSIMSIAVLLLAGAGVSFAQADAPAADAPKKPDAPQVVEKSFADIWRAGGWTMYPLSLFGIFATTLIVYNAIALRKKKFLNPDGVKEVEKLVNQLKIRDAIDYCEKHPSPITNIIGCGLSRADEREIDVSSVESAMEEASVEEFASPYVLINYLSVTASLAPMLGLYGTVSGMVKAFNTIAAEGAGSASKLADNIAEALITTATGMIVGIPAMFFFFLFKNKYGAIISSSSRVIGDLIYTMKLSIKYGPQDIEEIVADAAEAPVEQAPETPEENK
ncbi:MAG: MotA/TolQ/ExbB proton channel family protein [Candidatus Merdousia sp.]|nr:MotA/TolQ/ExbB proton channel family protein [Candidatus Merdousia sp.]